MTTPTFQKALDRLILHHESAAPRDMRKAFAEDPERFEKLSRKLGDFTLDFSKCAVSEETVRLLCDLARGADVEGRRDAMFAGEKINATEDRAVMHVALRAPRGERMPVDGRDVVADVHDVLDRMADFSRAIRSGDLTGHTGRRFTDVVNIGIGGSDLGPAMVTQALFPFHDGPRVHFVSNVDGAHIADTLKGLDPETTFFIVASKTFTTVETMTNAASARAFVADRMGEEAVPGHFAAVSTALDKVADFGIDAERVFGFWDWVGGRYSLWSAIGLPVMIAIGPECFAELLSGAHRMDRHFAEARPEENLPVLLALIGYWHRVVCGHGARAVIPYDQRLARLPAFLQQLDMESNGKGVALDGAPVNGPTGPLVWGEPGTNGQHAFFQALHQGTSVIPVEFLLAAEGHEPELRHHHDLLAANCLAQSEALMCGRTLAEARAQLDEKGLPPAEIERLAPHRVFPGNRPSLTLLYRRLDPATLGAIIALYEHRVFVEAQLFGINAFDQWGVELGKEMATRLLPMVERGQASAAQDASTAGLISRLAELRNGG